jgi:transcriptional regulator with XRE-family HTH domain
MSLVLDPDLTTTTSGVAAKSLERTVLTWGLLFTAVIGTNPGLTSSTDVYVDAYSVTGIGASLPIFHEGAVAEEVASSRDQLVRLGLTRQHIARALGVDRRSLSGWATGEIRPAPERLEALRALVALATTVEAERPDRVSEILLHRRGESDLLDQFARGSQEVLQAWRSWTSHPAATVTVSRRAAAEGREAIWAAAARAVAEGRLRPMERRPSVRADETYEMDLSEAEHFVEEAQDRPTRRGYS